MSISRITRSTCATRDIVLCAALSDKGLLTSQLCLRYCRKHAHRSTCLLNSGRWKPVLYVCLLTTTGPIIQLVRLHSSPMYYVSFWTTPGHQEIGEPLLN